MQAPTSSSTLPQRPAGVRFSSQPVKAGLRAHFEAGATHVCIQPVTAEGDVAARDAMIAALADT